MIECPIKTSEIASHYDRLSGLYQRFWGNHIHHGYFEGVESRHAAQIRLVEELASFARVPRGARVLDVGCGLGGSAIWLAETLGCSVVGLTLSPVQARMATRLGEEAGVADRVSFRIQDANDLGGLESRFDVVWAIESTEHLHDKPAFFRSARRCLDAGGILALCAWLVPEAFPTVREEALAREVCRGMLCPTLGSAEEHRGWIASAGFGELGVRDISRNVGKTWDLCAAIVRRGEVRVIARAADARTQAFVSAIPAMQQAYRTGAMRYGMFRGAASGPGAGR